MRQSPRQAGEEYIAARKELRQAEIDLVDHCERVASMRRALPPGSVLPDYRFAEGPRDLSTDEPTKEARLSDLVGDGWTAVVYHLMFHPDDEEACPMCSMWGDRLHGVSQHLDFAVIAKAPLPKLRAWARHRGWNGLRLLSGFGNAAMVRTVRGSISLALTGAWWQPL